MKPPFQDLESLVHRALRELPSPPAPSTLQSRVFAELERRAALPWWRRSYLHWPHPVRRAFLVVSAAIASVLVVGLPLIARRPEITQAASALSAVLSPFWSFRSWIAETGEAFAVVFRALADPWLYGMLGFLGACYLIVIGTAAAAYRAFSHRL